MKITADVMNNITAIASKHQNAMSKELGAHYPDKPYRAVTLAIGAMVAALSNTFADPEAREQALAALNLVLDRAGAGWRVVPVN